MYMYVHVCKYFLETVWGIHTYMYMYIYTFVHAAFNSLRKDDLQDPFIRNASPQFPGIHVVVPVGKVPIR